MDDHVPLPGKWKTRTHDAKAGCVKSMTPKKARIVTKRVPSGEEIGAGGVSPRPLVAWLLQFVASNWRPPLLYCSCNNESCLPFNGRSFWN